MATWAPEGLDGAAISLLMQLVRCGPRRQGELADVAMLDPSTVSRYVGQLVRRDLVERRPDPADGRAVQLVATRTGHAAAGRMIARRDEIFGEVLADWDHDEVLLLARLLTRLNDDVDSRRAMFSRPGATDVAASDGSTTARDPQPDAGPAAVHPEENR
jgi:DNA-binding MarR family transcriptional regulator